MALEAASRCERRKQAPVCAGGVLVSIVSHALEAQSALSLVAIRQHAHRMDLCALA